MNLSVTERNSSIDYKTQNLLKRMLNPLTGINKSIGFMSRAQFEPRMMTAGAELTGVHILRNRPDPGSGFYHIGGGGIFLNEPIIRCLGESLERYSQFIADVSGQYKIDVATYDEMKAMGRMVIHPDKLVFFSPKQFKNKKFPYSLFNSQMPIGWIKVDSLIGNQACWLPAQILLVGYMGREGEKKLNSSVTTGTAAHTDPFSAQRNALMELIQIDSTMGHWYSSAIAPRIEMDGRTKPISQLINTYFSSMEIKPRFYLLKNADLPGFSIACIIKRPGRVPRIGVGLGVGLRLNSALYGALLEANGVIQMAKKAIIDMVKEGGNDHLDFKIDPASIFDLDSNVVYYASPGNDKYIDEKFSNKQSIAASDLTKDIILDTESEVEYLISEFKNTRKELFSLDLTSCDLKQLGFYSSRVWSPDTLSLCLPSSPQVEHLRFRSYGGATNPMPHPYP